MIGVEMFHYSSTADLTIGYLKSLIIQNTAAEVNSSVQ